MATKTPEPAAEVKAPKKLGKFVVMQRIDRLLNSLSERERAGVLAWLFTEYGPRHFEGSIKALEPAVSVPCKHPGFGD